MTFTLVLHEILYSKRDGFIVYVIFMVEESPNRNHKECHSGETRTFWAGILETQ